MDRDHWLAFGYLLVGVALLLNPFYLLPDGGGDREITYHVREVTDEITANQALYESNRALACPAERACPQERRVLEEGALEVEEYVDDDRRYEVVGVDGDWYVPEEEYPNGSTVLTLEAVTPREAVARVARPATEFSPAVREAVETGSVTVYDRRLETFERGAVVEFDGSYYFHGGYRNHSHWSGEYTLPAVRAGLYAVGVTAAVAAGRRIGRREATSA